MSKPIPHGTLSGYNKHGCRCEQCREAKSAYNREHGLNRRVGRRAEQKRRADENLRHPCAVQDCTVLVGRESALCLPHEEERRRDLRDSRRRRLADLWNEGATLAQVAEALDCTVNSVGTTMCHMRADGWDLPYRYARRRERVTA